MKHKMQQQQQQQQQILWWFRALDLKSGGPWFKSSTLQLAGFTFGSPHEHPTFHVLLLRLVRTVLVPALAGVIVFLEKTLNSHM